MILKFLFKITTLLINNTFQKDGAQLKACLLQRQPSLMNILLEGDQKLHKWAYGSQMKLAISVTSRKAAVHITRRTSHGEAGLPITGHQTGAARPATELRTVISLLLADRPCSVLGTRLYRKHVLHLSQVRAEIRKLPWDAHINDSHKKHSNPETSVTVLFFQFCLFKETI